MGVIGILAHGHGDNAYAHYDTSLCPGDSVYTISSLHKVFQALKKPPTCALASK